ncbi:MAG: IdeS/Mac family cysteine endopeptidase [Opitutales bacterium]|nr:IdeS/Mac family cysteine endopeptidase [Opitutales bacterium]
MIQGKDLKKLRLKIFVTAFFSCVVICTSASAATLFAPGVTKESGWYDTNKAFTNEDSQLCWAATATNVITWWMDNYERGGGIYPEFRQEVRTRFFKIFKLIFVISVMTMEPA